MCANHSTIGAIIADLGNFEIPTLCLTGKRSSSELQVQLSVSPNSHLILTYLNFASFKVSATYVGPTGIEPVPLVLQTSVRTSYTKDPSERYYQLYYRATNGPDGTRTHTSPLSGQQWTRTTPVKDRFYRPAAVSERLLLPKCTS